jgi:hypothetical protein
MGYEQETQLLRVYGRISPSVKQFCIDRIVNTNGVFRMKDLADYVSAAVGKMVAPESAGRILRALRKKGEVHYCLLSRSDSLYKLVQVAA